MAKRNVIHTTQMQLFPTFKESTPLEFDRNRAIEKLTRAREELRVGQLDYDRLAPRALDFEMAARTKNHNRVKVNGEWYDVKFCKVIVRFLAGWRQRSSNLRHEIERLEKELG